MGIEKESKIEQLENSSREWSQKMRPVPRTVSNVAELDVDQEVPEGCGSKQVPADLDQSWFQYTTWYRCSKEWGQRMKWT